MSIITVSREFGSGGREIGKRLSDELGYSYYDREIETEIAEKLSMDENYVADNLERSSFLAMPIHYGSTLSGWNSAWVMQKQQMEILQEKTKILKDIAAKGDCVIVGRAADVLLEENNPFKLFVYADMDSRVKRCMGRMSDDESYTEKEMEKKIRQVDKERKNYHELFADGTWGDKARYHLCVNTTGCEIKTLIPAIAAYIKAWEENQ